MSFISDKVSEYDKNKISYSISDLEQIVANRILDSAQFDIESAIKRGEHHISRKYIRYEQWTRTDDMEEPPEQYLKSWSDYVIHLSDLVFPEDLSQLVYENEKKLNLLNIENIVRKGIADLGAKHVTVYVRFCKNAYATIQKSGFFRTYYVEEPRTLNKYKICYIVSW